MIIKMAAGRVSSVFRHNLFRGKVAIVTGGGTGIGKAITQELLYLGCNVMIASRKIERLKQAADLMKGELKPGNTAILDHRQCNIRKEEEVADLISSTLSKFGKLDFLINNGGGQFLSRTADIKLKGWNAVIDTNLTGTFLVCREAYNQWFEAHGGVIVNIIADMFKGFPTMSHTGAARAGVENLTKSLAIEWAENGVRINSVAPGSCIYSDTAAHNYGNMDIFDAILPNLPSQRLGTVEEVSGAVCFLLSPAANFISGDTLKVDAGSSLYTNMYKITKHDRLPTYRWSEDQEDEGDDDPGTKSKL